MNIPEFDEIIESNDQTEARGAHLEALRELVGNVYPNKFERSRITGSEDTISNILTFEPVAAIVKEIKEHISTLGEGEKPAPELKETLNARLKQLGNVKVSGRLTTTPRTMGKAAFVHLSDGANRLQIYVRRDDVKGVSNSSQLSIISSQNKDSSSEQPTTVSGWDLFKLLDGGDFVGVGGFLFLTNTGELSVHVETIQFLAKALLPMPDKMHGINDAEINRRYRYADLIASSLRNKTDEEIEEEKQTGIKKLTTREVFERRAKLISGMRRFLDDAGFIEVETPMLTPKATGAAAKPFKTHHNALDIDLYARIAPELYLKRLTVGGFEKVYELNRNFRNEGLSNKHNPEFTMLEFYCTYMDVNGMMDFCEQILKESVRKATGGSLQVKYGENEIDFEKPFERISMKEAIKKYLPELPLDFKDKSFPNFPLQDKDFDDVVIMSALGEFSQQSESTKNSVAMSNGAGEWITVSREKIEEYKEKGYEIDDENIDFGSSWDLKIKKFKAINFDNEEEKSKVIGNSIVKIFDNYIEEQLINPTFIIDYPKSISPLSKASPENPQIAERFELFINGMECANGFSELNDPQEQFERFRDQMTERETGDEEAMVMDEDYIRALAYGMPPAAGIGIGIDRLVMLLTNRHSIRDVILFPHMRPERKEEKTEETEENTAT